MAVGEVFRVNYYVGAMLAQGGNLWIDDSKVVFSPTSALDRAMGAQDVEIPFQQIRGVDYTGVLSRSFNIKTEEKIHKFEGGQAKKFWELLEKALPNKGLMTPMGAHDNGFCAHCGNRLKLVCSCCHHAADKNPSGAPLVPPIV